MVQRILAREGVPGFYRGFLPNALKNLPNKGALMLLFMLTLQPWTLTLSRRAECHFKWPICVPLGGHITALQACLP